MAEPLFNWTVYMGPCLEWQYSPETNPTCNGSCAKGWSRDHEKNLWVCAACRKPSHAYLRECDICEQIYLPTPEVLAKVNADEKFRYTLDHEVGVC